MTIFKPTAALALLVGCCAFGTADTAQAGGFSLQIGRPAYSGYGGGFNRGYYGGGFNRGLYGGGFNRGLYGGGFNRGFGGGHYGHGGFGGTSVYHDTTHVDVLNGQPVLHRSGHFDHYGPGHFGGHGGFGGLGGGFGGHHGHH